MSTPPTSGLPGHDAERIARASAVSPSAATADGPARPPNIVWIVLDCARAKNFALSGGDRLARTPVLDQLAARGTVFPKAVAPANWTVPSHMSFFTGLYPSSHGCRTFRQSLSPFETVASWLARRRYQTALFTEMVHLTAGYGLEEGFQEQLGRRLGISDEDRTMVNRLAGHADFLYSASARRLIERLPPMIVPMNAINHPQEVAFKNEVCGDYSLDNLSSWLARRDPGRPFFAFMNFVDAHEPYPHVENGHRVGLLDRWYARTPRYYLLAVRGLQQEVPWDYLVDGYLRCIEAADAKIGRVMERLRAVGEADRTLLIVTADHGQSFGEGGNVYHGCGATDSITRVPLLVVPPSELSVPRKVERWTSLCEISSWIKAVASHREPYDETGHAPLPFGLGAPDDAVVYCEGAPASDPNHSLRGIGLDQLWNRRLLAAYRQEEKFVLDLGSGAIFRWARVTDPDHRAPETLLGTEAQSVREEVFGAYEAAERARRLSEPPRADEDPGELSRRLRSWGYG